MRSVDGRSKASPTGQCRLFASYGAGCPTVHWSSLGTAPMLRWSCSTIAKRLPNRSPSSPVCGWTWRCMRLRPFTSAKAVRAKKCALAHSGTARSRPADRLVTPDGQLVCLHPAVGRYCRRQRRPVSHRAPAGAHPVPAHSTQPAAPCSPTRHNAACAFESAYPSIIGSIKTAYFRSLRCLFWSFQRR